MDRTYFERAHRQESRDAEWRMLNESLKAGQGNHQRQRDRQQLRRTVGNWFISIGMWLKGSTSRVAPCACLEDSVPHGLKRMS